MTLVDLNLVHDQLLQLGRYLGNLDLLDHIHWIMEGHREVLKTNAVDEDADHSVVPSVPAILSAVVHIFNQSFWLTSDAGWKGPTEITSNLYQVKASCIGVHPREDAVGFQVDFNTAMLNANTL